MNQGRPEPNSTHARTIREELEARLVRAVTRLILSPSKPTAQN